MDSSEEGCMSFATQLTTLRASRKISLQKLADAIDVSKTYLWELEKGARKAPSLELVKRIADYFNVTMQSLVGEDPESANADPVSVVMYRKFGELDDIDKEAISQMVDTMIERKKRREDEIRSRSSK